MTEALETKFRCAPRTMSLAANRFIGYVEVYIDEVPQPGDDSYNAGTFPTEAQAHEAAVELCKRLHQQHAS